jgi:hypothetical protein
METGTSVIEHSKGNFTKEEIKGYKIGFVGCILLQISPICCSFFGDFFALIPFTASLFFLFFAWRLLREKPKKSVFIFKQNI